MKYTAEALLTHATDTLLNCWPRRQPSRQQLKQARIVSHRGQHDNVHVRENTTSAFDAAVAAGVWGLETDIRYTADGEPVISHDADLRRVFDNPTVIADTTWSTLRDRIPDMLHLEQFVDRYAGRVHCMLELKARAPGLGEARLLRLLGNLDAAVDYHILALDTNLFAAVRELPTRCRVPVARFNSRRMLDYALTHECGGLAGHYLLLGIEHAAELQAAGLHIGTGFLANRAALWREMNRGVDWLFSNRAVELQSMLDRALSATE